MSVVWSEQALSDVMEIRDFIARDAPRFADLFVDRIFEAVERLTDFPLSGRQVPEFGRPDVREVLLGSYRIVYRIHEDRVAISTVFHTARLLEPGDVPGLT
ncbi:MAG: type II toxin-antitoxin system RelE/ParE family toxin [Gemmatimonadota bacterium]